jgi:hypothetical protein
MAYDLQNTTPETHSHLNTNWRYTGRVGVLSPLVAIYLFPMNNKRKRILNGQTRMGNPEKLAILGTQETKRRQGKKNTTQYVLDTTICK